MRVESDFILSFAFLVCLALKRVSVDAEYLFLADCLANFFDPVSNPLGILAAYTVVPATCVDIFCSPFEELRYMHRYDFYRLKILSLVDVLYAISAGVDLTNCL